MYRQKPRLVGDAMTFGQADGGRCLAKAKICESPCLVRETDYSPFDVMSGAPLPISVWGWRCRFASTYLCWVRSP